MIPEIALTGVSWGPRGAPAILHDLTFAVPRGQIVAVCGANGAGKSSLLRLIWRHQPPTRGAVLVRGRDLWLTGAAEAARLVAAVVQDQPADLDLTLAQVVGLGRLPHRRGWGAAPGDAPKVQAALCRMDLEALAHRPFRSLSGGERQRGMVARALAQEPQILVLDEPTNHLDIRHQLELLALLKGLGLTVITTLHDLSLAAGFADRVLVLAGGRIVADGPPAQALSAETLAQAFQVRARITLDGATPRFDFHL